MKYHNLSLIKKAPAIYRCLTINYKLFLGGTRTTRQAIAVPTQQDSIPPLCDGAYTQKVYHENLRFYRPQPQGRGHARRRDRAGGLDHSAGYIGSAIEGASLRWQRGSFFLLLPKHLSVSFADSSPQGEPPQLPPREGRCRQRRRRGGGLMLPSMQLSGAYTMPPERRPPRHRTPHPALRKMP